MGTRIGLLLLAAAAVVSAEDDRPMRWVRDKKLQEKIHAAIDKGVQYLIAKQNKAGYWAYGDVPAVARDAGRFKRRDRRVAQRTATPYDGGLTALMLYAMGASGIKRDHASVVPALSWIDRHPQFFDDRSGVGTYAASLLVLALTRLDAKHYAPRIRSLADAIAAGQNPSGMWGYQIDPGRKAKTDGSNTQFAVLALWAAHSLAGWNGPEKVWKRIESHYRRTQWRNGTWGYRPGDTTRLDTMTAAGAVSYVYARAALDGSEKDARASTTAQRGLAAHLRLMKRANWHNYYLVYGIERVGTVLGLRDLSWYEQGARILVRRQDKNGSWAGQSLGADRARCYETALAILFLSRATFPPRKGALTPPDRPRVTTPKNPDTHARAFERYLEKKDIEAIRKRGPGMIEHLITILERDGRKKARAAAIDLLQKLLDKRFLYDAGAPAGERKVMAAAIRATWQRTSR